MWVYIDIVRARKGQCDIMDFIQVYNCKLASIHMFSFWFFAQLSILASYTFLQDSMISKLWDSMMDSYHNCEGEDGYKHVV